MKHFVEDKFKCDIDAVPFDVCEVFDDRYDMFWP